MAGQKQRVLAALRSRGAHGITRVDFALPNVIDGGKPIINIPGRIWDLRKDGHDIRDEGERDGGCTVYRLLRDAQDTPPAPKAPVPLTESGLFEQGTEPKNAIFGWEDAA